MMARAGFSRWLPLLQVGLILAFLFLYLTPTTQRPPAPVDDFVLPERLSGRPLQALYRVEAMAVKSDWTPELLRLAGDLWREAGDITRALSYWQAAAEGNADAGLLRDLALGALEVQEWSLARETLHHLTALSPDDGWALFQLGILQAIIDPEDGRDGLAAVMDDPAYAEIAANLTNVLSESGGEATVLVSLGQALAEYELWAYAELAFTRAADFEPLPEALAYAGLARDMQGKNGSGWIEQAVRLAPDSAAVRLLQGLHLRQTGDFAGSQQALALAAALDPENPVMYAELGTAYQLLGQIDQARRWLEQAVALSGGDSRFQPMLTALAESEVQLLQAFGVTLEVTDDATAEPNP